MRVMYLYDIKAKNKKLFNRTKRMFYYRINRLPITKDAWKTKSTLVLSKKHERMMDSFFKSFGNKVEVYKTYIKSITAL